MKKAKTILSEENIENIENNKVHKIIIPIILILLLLFFTIIGPGHANADFLGIFDERESSDEVVSEPNVETNEDTDEDVISVESEQETTEQESTELESKDQETINIVTIEEGSEVPDNGGSSVGDGDSGSTDQNPGQNPDQNPDIIAPEIPHFENVNDQVLEPYAYGGIYDPIKTPEPDVMAFDSNGTKLEVTCEIVSNETGNALTAPTIDTTKPGNYTVTYSATDSLNKTATETAQIEVLAAAAPAPAPTLVSAVPTANEYAINSTADVTLTFNNPNGETINSVKIDGQSYPVENTVTTGDQTVGTISDVAVPNTSASNALLGTITEINYGSNVTTPQSTNIVAGLVYIPITSGADLQSIQTGAYSAQKTDANAVYRLTNDIDLAADNITDFTPITDFAATFDGQGYTISNYSSTTNGLFANTTAGAVIKNVHINGTVVGRAETYDDTVDEDGDGDVLEHYFDAGTGLLIGVATETLVENCSSNGIVYGYQAVGGLIGKLENGTVNNSYSSAVVCSGTTYEMPVYAYFGGLVGLSWESTVTNCYATGDLNVGGMTDGSYIIVGGLVGGNNGLEYDTTKPDEISIITNSYATGDVVADGKSNADISAGGLVGRNYDTVTVNGVTLNSEISNCYATGDVSAVEADWERIYVGGLVGRNQGDVTNCMATGDVSSMDTQGSGSTQIGGLVGKNDTSEPNVGVITNSYRYEHQIISGNGATPNSHGTIATYSQISSEDWYTTGLGWSTDTWNFQAGYYPHVKDTTGTAEVPGQDTWLEIAPPLKSTVEADRARNKSEITTDQTNPEG